MIGILTDTTLCIGCNECVLACKRANNLVADVPRRWQKPDGLSARNWTSVLRRPGGQFVRKQCRHCLEPSCVSVCPVGALKKQEEGPVTYDQGRCMGCRYCMMACPYGIPRYDWDQAVPYVQKCIFCYDRIKEGKKPACTDACPTGATIFGTREELLAEAQKRVRAKPELKLYGDVNEVGGTSVLYISDIDLDFLSHGKDLRGQTAPPHHTAPYLSSVKIVGPGVFLASLGVTWLIQRRMKIEAEVTTGEEGQQDE